MDNKPHLIYQHSIKSWVCRKCNKTVCSHWENCLFCVKCNKRISSPWVNDANGFYSCPECYQKLILKKYI